ncbi:Acyl-CoA dehydrogenase [Brevundimonas sp. SH203]|uniref:acyl-CoA dehydrogenase family protein n=1 Tax=Brevundimonas sp. SH203 TaxID=345167 RepID=UPI0009C70320|nr:acyl-CoA dehydrogenase family protein [Brevundimonas sp. SH203]GAW40302.1 Acyl-CoA dehydrogenase [Brevundimonas sp. SH203]
MSDQDFRAEVRAFLEAALTPEMRTAPRTIMLLDVDLQQAWHKRLAGRGWAVPTWPEDYGGTGWSREQQAIFEEELVRANAPALSPNLQMIGPVLIALGSDEQKARHLGPLRSGEVVWCQGYSEPGAGSDLAALRTQAVRHGDDYVVNGQKIWTSYAHRSDWMFCLVRTSSEGKPQAGITFLLVDMKTPGITVRPIHSIDGLHHLNEVFFNDVRVPVANRVGAENDGWTVGKYLLQHERNGVAGAAYLRMRLGHVRALAASSPDDEGDGVMMDDPIFARRLAEVEVDLLALECLIHRADAAPDPGLKSRMSSMLKLRGSEIEQAISEVGRLALGEWGRLDQSLGLEDRTLPVAGPQGGPEIMLSYMMGRSATIFGGSSEVQRGIIFKQLRQYGV